MPMFNEDTFELTILIVRIYALKYLSEVKPN